MDRQFGECCVTFFYSTSLRRAAVGAWLYNYWLQWMMNSNTSIATNDSTIHTHTYIHTNSRRQGKASTLSYIYVNDTQVGHQRCKARWLLGIAPRRKLALPTPQRKRNYIIIFSAASNERVNALGCMGALIADWKICFQWNSAWTFCCMRFWRSTCAEIWRRDHR